jgi:hypothetical protein
MDPISAGLAIAGFARKHWKLIAVLLALGAAAAVIGWLKVELMWKDGELKQASGRVVEAEARSTAHEIDAQQQHRYLTDQIEINRNNAALTEKLQQLVQAERQRAAKAKERSDILDRSYTALIGRLNDVDGNTPLSDQQRAFVRELWCMEQDRADPPSGCPGARSVQAADDPH